MSAHAAARVEARPFIKCAGGKSKLCGALTGLMPDGVESMRHVEPFVGGGAVFFARGPERALLGDLNEDLIATYEVVRDELADLLAQLARIARGHCAQRYYAVRERYNKHRAKSRAERAAQFIYLNKTCFNGLFRVNRKGEFNVPMGRYAKAGPTIADAAALLAASARLRHAELRRGSFECVLGEARAGDFVYLDPPYAPRSSTANFTGYTKDGFSQVEQTRLRDEFRELDRRGVKVMLSNSDVPLIRRLYRGYAIQVVRAARAINCDAKGRGPVRELVVRNYET